MAGVPFPMPTLHPKANNLPCPEAIFLTQTGEFLLFFQNLLCNAPLLQRYTYPAWHGILFFYTYTVEVLKKYQLHLHNLVWIVLTG